MSRFDNTEVRNPATKFFKWSGGEGNLQYWDGEQNVTVNLPVTFLVLDVLTTIKGWSDEAQSGIWSNEVRRTGTEKLVVRTKAGILGEGYYKDIKDHIKAKGAKFTASVYAAMKGENGLDLVNFQFKGSALSPWIDFQNAKGVYMGAVSITEAIEEKKGSTTYYSPVFTQKAVSEETNEAARPLHDQLQEYLKHYLAMTPTHTGNDEDDYRPEDPARGFAPPVVDGYQPGDAFDPLGDDPDGIPF